MMRNSLGPVGVAVGLLVLVVSLACAGDTPEPAPAGAVVSEPAPAPTPPEPAPMLVDALSLRLQAGARAKVSTTERLEAYGIKPEEQITDQLSDHGWQPTGMASARDVWIRNGEAITVVYASSARSVVIERRGWDPEPLLGVAPWAAPVRREDGWPALDCPEHATTPTGGARGWRNGAALWFETDNGTCTSGRWWREPDLWSVRAAGGESDAVEWVGEAVGRTLSRNAYLRRGEEEAPVAGVVLRVADPEKARGAHHALARDLPGVPVRVDVVEGHPHPEVLVGTDVHRPSSGADEPWSLCARAGSQPSAPWADARVVALESAMVRMHTFEPEGLIQTIQANATNTSELDGAWTVDGSTVRIEGESKSTMDGHDMGSSKWSHVFVAARGFCRGPVGFVTATQRGGDCDECRIALASNGGEGSGEHSWLLWETGGAFRWVQLLDAGGGDAEVLHVARALEFHRYFGERQLLLERAGTARNEREGIEVLHEPRFAQQAEELAEVLREGWPRVTVKEWAGAPAQAVIAVGTLETD